MVKDQEYLRNKASYCLDLAKKLGATSASVSVGHSISESVSFRNKVLDESNRSDNLGVSITTYIDKKKSSISSSNLLDENIKTLIEKCIETTKITPEDEFNGLPDKNLLANKIKDLDLYDESHIENDKKIEYLKELETATSDNDKIVNTESGFTENKSNFILASSDGFCEGYKTSSFTASCVAVAKDDKSMERDYDYTSKCFLSDIKSSSHLAKETREKTIKKLSPQKIGSEKINIIFDKRIASSLLSAFAGAISGSAIARGTSFLKDKLGEQVFSQNINIIDQPDILKGLGSRPFDSEGVKTETLKLVEKGQLKSYLVDTYNGKKLNLKSNGRCGGTSNLFFENGELSFDELLKSNS
ncbi:MAG: TldD/PmbA family protein, partial [Proteobacteria bacterium]|nr:TldD/PmbA family protein [Pseudomonadota bacterium]